MEKGKDMETKFFKTYRKSIQNKISDEQSYDHYWAALEAGLKGKKKIYVSLDGVYNQINLNTLKKAGGDFLINEYDFALVSNAKDILTGNGKTMHRAKRLRYSAILIMELIKAFRLCLVPK